MKLLKLVTKTILWKNGILLDETVAGQVRYEFPIGNKDDIEKDLDLLFSGDFGGELIERGCNR